MTKKDPHIKITKRERGVYIYICINANELYD